MNSASQNNIFSIRTLINKYKAFAGSIVDIYFYRLRKLKENLFFLDNRHFQYLFNIVNILKSNESITQETGVKDKKNKLALNYQMKQKVSSRVFFPIFYLLTSHYHLTL